MAGSYAAIYRRAREQLEAEAEQRLGRPLKPHEQNLFRSCGTLTRLESLGMTVYFAESAADLSITLAETSFASRFSLAVDETVQELEKLLNRNITRIEQRQLQRLGNIEALWELKQQLVSIDAVHREGTLKGLLQAA